MKKYIHISVRVLLVMFCVAIAKPVFSQRKSPRKEKKEKLDSVKPENSKKEEKKAQLKKDRERHVEIQDKKTRKRMKQTRKKSMIKAGKKKVPFYKRWFRRG